MDETGLVLALAQGDRAALEDTIRRYTHYVAAVAARALAPEPLREDLEEVVSDTFLALWRSRESLDPVRSLRPWLAVTARNLAIDRVRRRRETDAIQTIFPTAGRAPKSWRSGTSSTVSSGGWWTAWRSRTGLCSGAITLRRSRCTRWPKSWG